jgi:CRISP-associated protein Cas1
LWCSRCLANQVDLPEPAQGGLSATVDRLGAIVRRLEKPFDGDTLRGFEGEASVVYLSVFNDLILGEKPLFAFTGRSRRPPLTVMLPTRSCHSGTAF